MVVQEPAMVARKPVMLFPSAMNKLEGLATIFPSMWRIMDDFIDLHIRNDCIDVPYHYNERATLSILAGAIWRTSEMNLVLEEFGTEKGQQKGRQDIWFVADGQGYFAEAKQRWRSLPLSSQDFKADFDVLVAEQRAAEVALSESPDLSRPHRSLGVLFLVPYIKKGKISDSKQYVEDYFQNLSSSLSIWAGKSRLHILWAHFQRLDLCHDKYCSDWDGEHSGVCPCLDVLICTK